MAGNGDEEKSKTLSESKTLLEETFYVLSKKKSVFRVKLSKIGLSLIKESDNVVKEQLISVRDIIGCRCLRSKKQKSTCACQSMPRTSSIKVVDEMSGEHDDEDISAYLYIYAYILQNNGNNMKRDRTIITLRFRSFDKYEDNYKEAQRWRTVIKKLINGEQVQKECSFEFNSIISVKEDRRLLFLLNPKSGVGKGRALFQKKVVPILQEAEVPYDLQITKYANYAREFIRTSNIFQWTAVVVVGGDGILFEVLNGVFERPDWSEVLKHMVFAIIPGGSGNGLARSIAYQFSEPYHPHPTLTATLAVVKRHSEPMDIVRVETRSQIMFSFLSIGWGLLSDIDIESESLRVLGGQRFTLWSVARLIGLRSYTGKVSYLPVSEQKTHRYKEKTIFKGGQEVTNRLDFPDEVLLETAENRTRLDSWYSAASRRSAYFSMVGSAYQSTTGSDDDDDEENEKGGGKVPRMYGPASQIAALTAPVHENWVHLEGQFVMVHASYQSHLGEDCLFAPNSKLNDGLIWLLIVHAKATRTQLLHFLLGLSTGAHATSKDESGSIELVPCLAFRIEPDDREQGYMTVDGEHVEYGPVQAEIFSGLCRMLVP